MSENKSDGFWSKFSKIGIIVIVIYIVMVLVGLIVRTVFFSETKSSSIIPDAEVVVNNTEQGETSKNSDEATATSSNIVKLSIDNGYVAVLIGNTVKLNANMTTQGEASASDLAWTSADETIATVAEDGTVTGVAQGTTTITVSALGNDAVNASIDVTVRKIEQVNGITYVDGIMIVNKSYNLPSDYDPGLDEITNEAFEQLKADAAEEGLDIYIGSSYRDYDYQVEIYNNYSDLYGWEQADTFSARPGFSEHQTGLTIDCNTIDDAFGDTAEAKWLAEHCAEYGFIIRFPEGKEDITGYKYEPWHIRYVGVEDATKINELGVCLEEYLGVDSVYAEPWEG